MSDASTIDGPGIDTTLTHPTTTDDVKEAGVRFREWMRVLIVAGIPAGVLLVGVGSRVAMLLLRLTSPDEVLGVQSDDDFTIGTFTFAGTLNLLMIGALVGVIGAGVYRLVSPWLLGPPWFRRITTGMAGGAVGGAMLVHADGIDFTLLKPTWFAIGLFVALPAMFAIGVGWWVDRVARPDSVTARGPRRRWLIPLVLVLCIPPTAIIVAFVAPFVGICAVGAGVPQVQRVRARWQYGLAIRAGWLAIAAMGLVALVSDVRALAA